jgi:glucose/arabinose dehydrogenase
LLFGMSTPRRRLSAVLALAAVTAWIAGCGGGSSRLPPERTPAGVEPSPFIGRLSLEKVGDFDQPDYVTQPPGSGDLYVVERQGTVRIVRNGDVLPVPALDITDQVSSEGEEQGLLSIAFSPDFQSSRLVYAYYTGTDQDQHVVRYTVADDGTFDRGSAREILHMSDFAPNHNGGLLLFGPDGYLYIGTGDGGSEGDPEHNGQDLGSLLGKLLRVDPNPGTRGRYSIPPDNPFVDRPGARPEIYSYGLRNPWRFSFDSGTGALSIGDVGQDTMEEIDYMPKGQAKGVNFGWSAFEGTNRFNTDQTAPNAVPPILTYGRDQGCSVIGGYVVRDPSLPLLLGRYVYGDYCTRGLLSFEPAVPQARDNHSLGLNVPGLSSFGQDNAGHIYAVSLDGPVYRLAQ